MPRSASRPKPRPAILRVGAYEHADALAADEPGPVDPDADKDPFFVADQRAAQARNAAPPARSQAASDSVGELPIPDSAPSADPPPDEPAALPLPAAADPAPAPSDALPLPDTNDAPPSPAQTRAVPASQLPNATDPASQLPDATDPAGQRPDATDPLDEPAPFERLEKEMFSEPDDDFPDLPDELPSGDLSEGISTVPGDVGCKGYDEQCRKALSELQERDITTVIVGVVIEGTEGQDYPCDCVLGRDFDSPNYVRRDFAPTLFTWKAAGLCHKPLYFEDVQLERYGHSWNPVLQPFVSGAHFFVSVPLLPYKMGLKPPHECVYTLGYYRPGNCAPYMFEPIPLSLRAAVWQGFGTAAFAFWFWPPN